MPQDHELLCQSTAHVLVTPRYAVVKRTCWLPDRAPIGNCSKASTAPSSTSKLDLLLKTHVRMPHTWTEHSPSCGMHFFMQGGGASVFHTNNACEFLGIHAVLSVGLGRSTLVADVHGHDTAGRFLCSHCPSVLKHQAGQQYFGECMSRRGIDPCSVYTGSACMHYMYTG